MPFAPDYSPTTSFADDETNQASGRSTVRTAALDVEFANVEATTDALNANLKRLQRDDGKLRDFLVEPFQISEQLRAMLVAAGKAIRGAWAPATRYSVGDLVQRNAIAFMCVTGHVSGSVFTIGFWLAISGDGSAAYSAEQAAASASSAVDGAVSATAAAATAYANAVAAAASSVAAATSALDASNAANSISSLNPVNLSSYMQGFLAKDSAGGALTLLGAYDASLVPASAAVILFDIAASYSSSSIGAKLRETISVRDAGAFGDFDPLTGVGNDDSPKFALAVAAAIVLRKRLLVPQPAQGKGYLFRSPWNLTSTSTILRHGLNIEFESKSSEYKLGTLIYGETGNLPMIDTSGSDGIVIKNLGLVPGFAGKSTIGLLQGRTTGPGSTGGAGDQYFENPYINMGSVPDANDGFGTMGVVNIAGEETRWHNAQIWANSPVIISWSSNIIATTKSYTDATKNFSISSPFVGALTTGFSNTVFAFTGLGRLIAYDFSAPCVLTNAAGTVDLGDTFMQKRLSGTVDPSVVGIHVHPLELWGAYQIRHFGAVEQCRAYALIRRALSNADFRVRVGDTPISHTLPMIWLWSDGGSYEVAGLNIEIDSPAPTTNNLFGWRRYSTTGGAEPHPFALSNVSSNINQPWSSAWVSPGTFRTLTSGRFKFKDRVIEYTDTGSFNTKVEKNIGNSAASAVLLSTLQFPQVISGLSAIGMRASLEGVLSNATIPSVGNVSSAAFRAALTISQAASDGSLTASTPVATIESVSTVTGGGNTISALAITATIDNTNRRISIFGHATETGADQAGVLLKARMSVWSTTAYKEDVLLLA